VASSTKFNVYIADDKKKVHVLGEANQSVPIEVLPFAIALVQRRLQKLDGTPILRETKGKLGPVISDNGNAIMDVSFGPIADPATLNVQIKLIPGVVETGLFVGLTNIVYLGSASAVQQFEYKK
jgi:ribose 5-phosphate isomerase A